MRPNTCVGLKLRDDGNHREWIFEGTDEMLEYPEYASTTGRGLCSFGTIKVKGHEGVIAYRASPREQKRLADAGWRTIGHGTDYIYVTRGDLRRPSPIPDRSFPSLRGE